MIIGYARISFEEDANYTSVAHQESMIREHGRVLGWNIKMLTDDNYSGYLFDRPGFQEMERLVDEGKVECIIAKDFSRIGRHNAKVLLFLEKLKEKKVRVILISEGYDSDRDSDDLVGLKTWFNEYYVKDISRKVRSVFNLKKSKGEIVFNPPYGYMKMPGNRHQLTPHPERAEVVRKIFKMYIDGAGTKAIANALNEEGIPTGSMEFSKKLMEEKGKEYRGRVAAEWHQQVVLKILMNDVYIGVMRIGKTTKRCIKGKAEPVPESQQAVFYNHHEPIVSFSEFTLAQEVRQGRAKYKGRRRHDYLFTGKIFCADCGAQMTGKSEKRYPHGYECVTYHRHGTRRCSRHLIVETALVEGLMVYLKEARDKCAAELESIPAGVKKDNLEKLKAEIAKLTKEVEVAIRQKIEAGANGGHVEIYEMVESEKSKRLSTLKTELAMVGQEVRSAKNVLDGLDHILREGITRRDVEYLIDRVEVDGDKNVTYKLKVYQP